MDRQPVEFGSLALPQFGKRELHGKVIVGHAGEIRTLAPHRLAHTLQLFGQQRVQMLFGIDGDAQVVPWPLRQRLSATAGVMTLAPPVSRITLKGPWLLNITAT